MKSKTIAVRLEESTYIEVQRIALEHRVKESAVVAALTTHSINQIVDQNVQGPAITGRSTKKEAL